MKKQRNKPFLTITINKNVLDNFRKVSDKKSINKSKLIENLIIKWIEENEK